MKKLLMIAAVAAVAFTSCKKSGKGKLSNEWVVSSFEMTSTETDSDNETETETIKADDKTVTETWTSSASTTTVTTTGVVNEFSYTINKDGSWTSVMDITYTETDTDGTYVSNEKRTTSGTWDFLGGVSKDWKKNERVVFNTTSYENKYTDTFTPTSGTATTSSWTSSGTYDDKDGNNGVIYVIVESKGKELQLSQEGNSSWSWTSTSGSTSTTSTDKEVSSTKMTLIQK